MKYTALLILLLFSAGSVFSQKLSLTSHTLRDTSSAKKYEITAYYPQADFGPDALMGVRGIASDINNDIVDIINGQMVSFRQAAEEVSSMDCALEQSNMEINYSTYYKNDGYISVLFETFSNPRCAAHPMTFRTSFNYSYFSKGLLTIDSLFEKDSGWLEYISGYCIKELKEKSKTDGLENNEMSILSGAGAKAENFRTFTFNGNTLDIIFNLYQVGPYIWGFQTVSIPLKNISKMLDENGPLGFAVKK